MSLRDLLRRTRNRFFRAVRGRAADPDAIPSGLGDVSWVLYGLARSMRPEVCVEIGSAAGKSACHIGRALKENGRGRLYAIDPHVKTDWNDAGMTHSLDVMRANLRACGVADVVEIVRDFSQNVAPTWTRKIDVLFIDGDHTYEGVRRDWELFSPFLNQFGIALFHDTAWDVAEVDEKWRRADMGVPRFVNELRESGYPVLTVPNNFGLSLVQATPGGIPLVADLIGKSAAQ